MDVYTCYYCGETSPDPMTDRTCDHEECQAQLHRSYGDAAFAEFCERENMDPSDWDEFFEERDKERINQSIQDETRKAKFAVQNLIKILEEKEWEIGRNLIEVRGIRSCRDALKNVLPSIERISKYRIKEE